LIGLEDLVGELTITKSMPNRIGRDHNHGGTEGDTGIRRRNREARRRNSLYTEDHHIGLKLSRRKKDAFVAGVARAKKDSREKKILGGGE